MKMIGVGAGLARVARHVQRLRWCNLTQRHAFSTENGKMDGGFTFPAPRALKEIVKVDLLANEGADEIRKIWADYHAEKDDCIASTLSGAEVTKVVDRARGSPFFIVPVYRKDGFFNMLCQFQEKHFLITYLEAFKENPALAPPCVTVSLYKDLVDTKDLALVRTDVINMLDKPESEMLMKQVIASYLDDNLFSWVDKFNHKSQEFDFEAYRLAISNSS
ncbi:TPA: hypothetical protein N0F65_008607 [Lagenidium giganteum]|uniref:ATP synthase mitochondrial F1 complex assembly factor 1 n=1 Tax=Lagenidium giganteum TaxID=4803 RepID=A0AAV2Z2B6_9STRA|nr:TPA: hypothetical protein N0F65_008607 [Lagenidium giganteum]